MASLLLLYCALAAFKADMMLEPTVRLLVPAALLGALVDTLLSATTLLD